MPVTYAFDPEIRNSGPAGGAMNLAAGDDEAFFSGVRGIYVGGTGDLVLEQPSPNGGWADVTYTDVPVGVVIPTGAFRRVRASSTATDLVIFW